VSKGFFWFLNGLVSGTWPSSGLCVLSKISLPKEEPSSGGACLLDQYQKPPAARIITITIIKNLNLDELSNTLILELAKTLIKQGVDNYVGRAAEDGGRSMEKRLTPFRKNPAMPTAGRRAQKLGLFKTKKPGTRPGEVTYLQYILLKIKSP